MLLPLLVHICIVLRLTGEGDEFFLHESDSKVQKAFKRYKLATVLRDSSNIGNVTVALRSVPRLLAVGKFLRKMGKPHLESNS